MSKKVGLPDFVKMKHDDHFVDEISRRTRTAVIRNIPVEKIEPSALQPRKEMGDLSEMVLSIKEKGVLEPILVRPKSGKYEIIAGERRFRAAKAAGYSEIPCIEYDIPDNEALEYSIIENIQRKDLNVFETAFSFKSLAEIYGYTHEDIAKKIGRSRVTVSELIRLTDLPTDVIAMCTEMNIEAKSLLLQLVKLENREAMVLALKEYAREPYSRDKLKTQREGDATNQKKKAESETKKPIRFKFVSDDKAINIHFDIKREKISQAEVISFLHRLIDDIRQKGIKKLDL